MMLLKELWKDFHLLHFYNLWKYSNQKNGKNIEILDIHLVYLIIFFLLIKGTKLLPEFLARCDILENSFKNIFTSEISLQVQFENFLIDNISKVQHMTEREFYRFIINQSIDSAYGDYIKYLF